MWGRLDDSSYSCELLRFDAYHLWILDTNPTFHRLGILLQICRICQEGRGHLQPAWGEPWNRHNHLLQAWRCYQSCQRTQWSPRGRQDYEGIKTPTYLFSFPTYKFLQVEVVVDAQHAPPPAPVKTLSDRVAQPKAQPKPATAARKATADTSARGGRGRGRAGARRGRNANRPKPKTVEELDAEMVDYYDNGNTNAAPAAEGAANTGVAQANGGGEEMGMDEIS